MVHLVGTALQDEGNRDQTAQLELRALERMVGALCRHIEQLAGAAGSRGVLGDREAILQLEVYRERRDRALDVLHSDAGEPRETRIARLQKHVEALDCSRSYFRAAMSELHAT